MQLGTLMAIEFFGFFGGILAFGFHQLYSLKKLERRDRERQAEAAARGETVEIERSPIPGWMARR